MPDFSDGFRHYIPADQDRTKAILKTGIVVVDTNVLLDTYRYTTSARNELIAALRALADRLWIPHQVALEFHRNRLKVIASHGDAYGEVIKAIAEFKKQYETEIVRRLQEFANRVSLDERGKDDLVSLTESTFTKLIERINGMRAAHGVSDRYMRNDPVLEELQVLFAGKVGGALASDVEAQVRVEAEKRIREERPPGFKDSAKDDPCGDYLLWHQSLAEAKSRAKPLLLITRDNKDDWFQKIRGKSAGARPELVEEALQVAGVEFVALPTKTFLIYAGTELNTTISQATLAQTDAIRTSTKAKSGRIYHLSPEGASFARTKISNLLRSLERIAEPHRTRVTGSQGEPDSKSLTVLAMIDEDSKTAQSTLSTLLHPSHIHPDGEIGVKLSPEQLQLLRNLERESGRVLIEDRRFGNRSTEEILKEVAVSGLGALERSTRVELTGVLRALVGPTDIGKMTRTELLERIRSALELEPRPAQDDS